MTDHDPLCETIGRILDMTPEQVAAHPMTQLAKLTEGMALEDLIVLLGSHLARHLRAFTASSRQDALDAFCNTVEAALDAFDVVAARVAAGTYLAPAPPKGAPPKGTPPKGWPAPPKGRGPGRVQ